MYNADVRIHTTPMYHADKQRQYKTPMYDTNVQYLNINKILNVSCELAIEIKILRKSLKIRQKI